MAGIRKLENRAKPWQVRIRRQGKSLAQYFRTKREASEFATQVEADFDRWSKLLGSELKQHVVGDLLDRYLSRWSGKDHNTPRRLAWWKDQFGARPLSQFDADTVREALARLETEPAPYGGITVTTTDRHRSGPTVNRFKAAISAAFKAGIDGGWFGLKDNPAASIRRRKETHRFGRGPG